MEDIYKDRESIMKQWDSWRKHIANGDKGSWPRDAFESLLDYFEERMISYENEMEYRRTGKKRRR